MKIIDLIIENKLSEAKNIIREKLNVILQCKLEEVKRYVAEKTYVESEEELTEAVKKSTNIVKMGRIKRIRRRIRRNNKGRIVVQRNIVKSAVKGYRVQGKQLVRITATQRINKPRKLKRYWKYNARFFTLLLGIA